MENKIYNQKGEEAGKIKLPENVFGLPWNGDLVHQVVVSMRANSRANIAYAKDRSEVSGGGRKPWKQKGTGRARHGSRRSPIWAGGGATHAPTKERDYTKKINKKVRVKALYSTLSEKLRQNEILFLDKLELSEIKTKTVKEFLSAISKIKGFDVLGKKNNSAIFYFLGKDENIIKSFENIGNVAIEETRNMNPVDVLNFKYLIIVNPKDSLEILEDRSKSNKTTENK